MPVMNGPSATKILRSMGCRCLIVGVSGDVLPADVEYYKKMGAYEVLPKPLKLPSLLNVWETFLLKGNEEPSLISNLANLKPSKVLPQFFAEGKSDA